MGFKELNSVEYFIIHELTGVNLNSGNFAELKPRYGTDWQFRSASDLNRSVNEVLMESELKNALIRLKPEI